MQENHRIPARPVDADVLSPHAVIFRDALGVPQRHRQPVAVDHRVAVEDPLEVGRSLLRPRSIAWNDISGTEQMIGGDRLIVYHDTPRGMRFVALNLNLVKGRRDFLALLDARLKAMGFAERVVERSRYLSRR